MLRGALHLRLSFLTIAALVVGALAACGGDDDGSGSGTNGDATLLTCSLGKMSARECQATCEDMGEDHGACSSEGGAAACVCCSKGDPGCPV
ncbi:MAG: hypothetical protein KC420_18860 [Myxococcales bacterium]|nr:hypothetical protein [Myxococcales bacterium]MCB9705409.1 hypothetical protein [Myxococcales bacterium]